MYSIFKSSIDPEMVLKAARRLSKGDRTASYDAHVVLDPRKYPSIRAESLVRLYRQFIASFQIPDEYIQMLSELSREDDILPDAWTALYKRRTQGAPRIRYVPELKGNGIILKEQDYWVDILMQPSVAFTIACDNCATTWAGCKRHGITDESVFLVSDNPFPDWASLDAAVAECFGYKDLARRFMSRIGINNRYRAVTVCAPLNTPELWDYARECARMQARGTLTPPEVAHWQEILR